MCGALVLVARATVTLFVSPVGNWDINCGYEEALHSNGEVLVLPEKGDQIGQGIKCQLVKTVECGCQWGGTN